MVDKTITAMLLVVAAIHLVPITGFFGGPRVAALYGIDLNHGTLEVLVRHRAVLFGILGTFFVYAAFKPALQPIAFVGATVSMASFFYLAAVVAETGPAIRKIVLGDIVASICLAVAVVLYGLRPSV